jgi:hypothetical protein
MMTRYATSIAITLCVLSVSAQTPPDTQRNFVSCPIVRDTATVPCWLSEYAGELYYLGIQTDVSADFDPPFLGHKVLVEGTVSDQPRICGGIVLEPVVISPMLDFDAGCNTILPAEDRYTVPFAPRPPGPSGGRLAFQQPPAPEAALAPPFEAREFELYYDFGMLIMGRHAGILTRVLDYATTTDAREIVVTGSAGATLLSDGVRMTEDAGIALERATEVARLLETGGLASLRFEIRQESAHTDPDGIDDWKTRRTVIRVVP